MVISNKINLMFFMGTETVSINQSTSDGGGGLDVYTRRGLQIIYGDFLTKLI